MEELIVLSQNDLERERYRARVKVQRDELSRLHSAREEGLEQGREQGREQGQLIGAVPSGRSVSERPLRSSNVYISFWTTSEPAPDVRAKSSVSSKTGVWMRR